MQPFLNLGNCLRDVFLCRTYVRLCDSTPLYNYSQHTRHGTNARNRWNCNTSGTLQSIPKNMIFGIVAYKYTCILHICTNNRSPWWVHTPWKRWNFNKHSDFSVVCEWFSHSKTTKPKPKTSEDKDETSDKGRQIRCQWIRQADTMDIQL